MNAKPLKVRHFCRIYWSFSVKLFIKTCNFLKDFLKEILINFWASEAPEIPKRTFFAKFKNLFAKLIFSRQNFFFGILDKGNVSERKKIT